MEHEGRCVGNSANAYTTDMDFYNGSKLSKLTYSVKTIYSMEARRKLRLVLNDFKPDVCHLNNFNYQLTPSVILEIVNWQKQAVKKCKIIYTAHDYQLVCPNHMMNIPTTHENCTQCLGGHFFHCVENKCIHGSTIKSFVGTMEALFWNWKGTYKYIDKIICCSAFMKQKMDSNPIFKDKTITLHNFTEKTKFQEVNKKDYILYFGRFSWEKGIRTFIAACKQLPDIPFVAAGAGMYEKELRELPNVTVVGFKSGEELKHIIQEARFSVCPSECYENCPFSIMESLNLGTPVLGADIGGIPELIAEGITGKLFESGNEDDLVRKIKEMYMDHSKLVEYSKNCRKINCDTVEQYCHKLLKLYKA